MTRRPEYLRYLEAATQAEFAERLLSEGFAVQTEMAFGDIRFDLIARKGDRAIAYEFKSGKSPKSNRGKIEQLQRAAKDAGFEFHVVVVTPPPRVNVEIDELASQLQDYLINESFPQELDALSTHTSITGVSDVSVSDIRVGQGQIRISGAGAVEVDLQYGSHSDDGVSSSDSYPFSFEAVLSATGELQSIESLEVDTSTFYDQGDL